MKKFLIVLAFLAVAGITFMSLGKPFPQEEKLPPSDTPASNNDQESPSPVPTHEVTEVSIPVEWKSFSDKGLGISLQHPESWTTQASPNQGYGGVARLTGKNNSEAVYIDVGKHDGLVLEQNQTLRQLEMKREPHSQFESERVFSVNGRDVYQKVVPITSGGPNSKKYGIYSIFMVGSDVYFLELYTDQPFEQFELVTQIIASMKK